MVTWQVSCLLIGQFPATRPLIGQLQATRPLIGQFPATRSLIGQLPATKPLIGQTIGDGNPVVSGRMCRGDKLVAKCQL